MFKPFENDHQSTQIGELIFENQTDKVIVYGDIDIYNNLEGLQQARKLKDMFTNIAQNLEASLKQNSVHNYNTDEGRKSHSDESDINKSKVERMQTGNSKDIENPFS